MVSASTCEQAEKAGAATQPCTATETVQGTLKLASEPQRQEHSHQTRVTADFMPGLTMNMRAPTQGDGRPCTAIYIFPLGYIPLSNIWASAVRPETKLGFALSLCVVKHSFKTKENKMKHLPT